MSILVEYFLMGGRTQIHENLQPSRNFMADLVLHII